VGQTAIADDVLAGNLADVRSLLATLALDREVRFAALVDEHDHVLIDVGRRHEGKALAAVLPPDAMALVARVRERLSAEVRRIGNGELIAMSPVALGRTNGSLRSGRIGLLVLCAGDRIALGQAYQRTALEVVAVTLIVLVLLALMYLVLARDVTRPLGRFMAVITRLREGELGARVGGLSGAEFGRLAQAFDAALDTVERQTRDIVLSETRLRRTNELAGVIDLEWDLVRRELIVPHGLWALLGRTPLPAPLAMDAFTGLVHADDRARFATCLERTLADGDPFADEFRMETAHGQNVWLRIQGALESNADGTARRLLALAQDVSARKRAEQRQEELTVQLHTAQKLEAIGLLSGGIAHDFNNILAAIIGFARLTRRQPSYAEDVRLVSYLDEMEAAAERGRELVTQLLTFSQDQPGVPEPLELAAVVDDVTRLLQPLLSAQIALSFTAEPDLPLVPADATSARQIVMNLCLNARDAQPAGGHIGVSLARSTVEDERCASCQQRFGGEFVVLAVSDAGPGITKPVLARIFDPFFTTKRDGDTLHAVSAVVPDSSGGSGLGLSVVHGAIHQLGGHVTVSTAAGGGTCFAVYFPCSAGAESAPLGAAANG
ncbi:MAG: ATP-binding protein, partial [Gammaproteobacteria bacterium]